VNASVVLRFSALDEVKPVDTFQGVNDDVRGQIFYDFERGVIKPRPVSFTPYIVDRSNPVPSIMIPFPPGLQTPLSALGSKMMSLWRYCDLGWNAADETKYNVDVYGLHWSPIGGIVLRDFFEDFEIRLAHSRFQPDEDIDQNLLPKYRSSGLRGSPSFFTENILQDPIAGQKIVHQKSLGYVVDPADITVSVSGTPLMPYPLNRGGTNELVTYTWRNTSGRLKGAPSGSGVPLDIEAGAPLNIVPGGAQGSLWGSNNVPTAGLPLLIEYRCFPSSSGIGLNPLDISLAINSSAVPNFRAFSTGGVNSQGNTVKVNPDTSDVPSGGFNPSSTPPGKATKLDADNSFYIGQLDVVTKVSQANTVWIDTLFTSPSFLDPVILPTPGEQPLGTSVTVDFRGATGFDPVANGTQFDSQFINAYGNLFRESQGNNPPDELDVDYLPNDRWQSSINRLNGSRYFQLRFTFINDIGSGLNAELSAVGVAFFGS